jgi:hypothetical protein
VHGVAMVKPWIARLHVTSDCHMRVRAPGSTNAM